jgi:hypothetical protein
MFLNGQGKSNRERFFVRNVTQGQGFGFRHNNLGGFSCLGHRHLMPLQFGHVASFVSVPRPATGSKAWLPAGGRESNHADQQEHDAGDKGLSVMRDDSLHASVEESRKSPWIIQDPMLPSDLPPGKLLQHETLKTDAIKLHGSLARAFLDG